jgi:Ti-type conjugative transfer relaxase TraA
MAIYHFSAKVIQRSQGRSAIAAAAYRAAEALHDHMLGRTFNYLDKPDVVHSEILLPTGAPARWLDRAVLWNEAQQVERRKDAVLAREIELALPRELSQAEAVALAQDFVREQFVARGMVADLNVHWGRSADGEAQPHAHIMLVMRRVVPGSEGHPEKGAFGLKERAWNDKALLRSWRARWAELVNERLAEAGIDGRIDHRSNAARGIDLEPQNKIGPAGARRAVRGEDAERADEHRAVARRNGERLLAEPELALQLLTRQQSTFTRQDLARLVNQHSDGAAQFTAIMAKVEASPELVRVGQDGRDQARYSTREMIAIERRMEAAALDLSRRTTHAVAAARRRAVLAGSTLGAEQQLAFGHVTRSRDLAVVVGYAGSGKSTMLGAARQAWEAEGYTVRGTALSGIAAEGLGAGSGIASRTIASWEHAWAQGRELLGPRDVLVMDEAGMVGSRQMDRVLVAVREAGAKLVLVGDHEQLQAIEAGAAFRAIAERVGAAEITEVRRQQTEWQRLATRELATGQTGDALDRYAGAGMLHAHATDDAARAALIAGWQDARQLAPDDSRRDAGELGADQVLPTELGVRAFAVGDRIYFLRNERGLGVKNGTLGTIVEIAGEGEGARLTVRLDRVEQATGVAAVVSFGLAEYAHIDHGYAATVHKAQSVTVDRAHMLATPGMDRHLAYVALTRHRQTLALHWSEESVGSREGLIARLSRERAKDTTLDYGESDAELCAAYAERRGLQPVAPASEIAVAGAGRAADTDDAVVAEFGALAAAQPEVVRRNVQRAHLDRTVRPMLGHLQRAAEQQESVTTAIAAAMERLGLVAREAVPEGPTAPPARPRDHAVEVDQEASKPATPSRADPFDGLDLGVGPLSPPIATLRAAPLADAVVAFLVASRDGQKMVAAGLPLLAHHEAALRAAREKIEALRPGFADDLVAASERQPVLVAEADASVEGVAPLIAVAQGIRADREETARRRAEHEALAPVRDRLLKERIEAWWRKNYPHNPPWDRSAVLRKMAQPAEEALKRDMEAMPAAELRRMEAAWKQTELNAPKPSAMPSSAPRRSGPSPF